MFPDLHPKQQQHQRASSAPCSPLFVSPSPSSLHHHVHKNVHFPSQEEGGLATIRVFNRSARPASLSRLGEETETDTDGEASGTGLYGNGGWPGWSGKYVGGSTFPFPRFTTANAEKKSPLNPAKQKGIQYNIDWSVSSVIPRKNVDRRNENVFFESLQVVHGDHGMRFPFFLFYFPPLISVPDTSLQGSLLVRNITYRKTVMARYTVDDWETVNDVLAWYDGNKEGWDRFKFSISLGGEGLQERVVWLVGKYAGGVGEGESGDAVVWWDNNEGKNYRVGFKEVVDQEERVEVYKRGVVVSAPSMSCLSLLNAYALIDNIATYTSPTPASTLTRPKLSDPQISSSTFSAQQSPYQQEREKERERERVQHQAAITQSTLGRLKKLNLKNYAAPRGYGYAQSSATKETPPSSPKLTPPVLTLTSASPTTSSFVRPSGSRSPPNLSLNTTLEMSSPTLSTPSVASTTSESTDSTPLQTPTQGDEGDGEEGWKVGGEEESLRWSLGMENGHFATTLIPSPKSSPTTTPLGSPVPVSIPGDRNTFSYSGGVEMGTSPPFSDLKETVVGRGVGGGGGGSVYWDWGTAGVALGGGEGKKESAYESTDLTSGGGGSGLIPPRRRRGLQQKRGSGSSPSSGSDSDSKSSKLPSPLTSTPTPTPPSTTTSVTPKQKAKPPKLNLPTPTLTRPSLTSPSSVQSPIPKRGLGYNSPPQPQRNGHRYYQSMPSFIGNSKLPSTPGDSDAIYQALVREWCFAQGPSNSNSGETTPVLVNSPSPLGLICDGE